MKYRSRSEITAMMLDTANRETTKTKIMYNAFLSYNQLKEYLTMLIENDLIEYHGGTKIFRTTEKGLNFLKMHNAIGELLPTKIGNEELI
jgi:predicted transcriptional regulator